MKVKAKLPANMKQKEKKVHSAARKGKFIYLCALSQRSPSNPDIQLLVYYIQSSCSKYQISLLFSAVPMKAKILTAGARITQQGEKILRNRIEKAARALAQPETESKKNRSK